MSDQPIKNVRNDYDRLAEQYAKNVFDELSHKPLDRELLDRFADQVRGQGQVCDLGCGPGHVARYLHEALIPIYGLDLSPGMLHQARQLNPGIRFEEGDMSSLPISTSTLAGLTAFYAIVNIPQPALSLAFHEMARVLQPNGLLLLAFHIGDDVLQPGDLWGVPISMKFFLFQPTEIAHELEAAGLIVEKIIEREPYPEVEYPSRRAYLFARRPAIGSRAPAPEKTS
jgi:ubiquinone/menaquinone biosynthesis C-methylase UbiE